MSAAFRRTNQTRFRGSGSTAFSGSLSLAAVGTLSGTGSGGTSTPPAEQVYTANDSFVATSTTADIWGWGAGGGAGGRRQFTNGGSGASGSYSFIHLTNLVVGRTYNVEVAPVSAGVVSGAVSGTTAVQSAPSRVIDSVTSTVIWQAGSGRGGATGGTGISPQHGAAGVTGDSIGDTILPGEAGQATRGGNAPNGGGLGATTSSGAGNAPGGGGFTGTSGSAGAGGPGARGEVHVQQAA